jgi:hypothetical protein
LLPLLSGIHGAEPASVHVTQPTPSCAESVCPSQSLSPANATLPLLLLHSPIPQPFGLHSRKVDDRVLWVGRGSSCAVGRSSHRSWRPAGETAEQLITRAHGWRGPGALPNQGFTR